MPALREVGAGGGCLDVIFSSLVFLSLSLTLSLSCKLGID